jgi:hypothetical protein
MQDLNKYVKIIVNTSIKVIKRYKNKIVKHI